MTDVVAALAAVVGAEHVLVDPDLRAPYETDWTRRFSGRAVAVVRPGSTAEVQAGLRVAAAHRCWVVPQGGNTGLVGGGIPTRDRTIVLSTRRLDAVGPVDLESSSVVVGAGATLAAVRDAAHAHDLTFGVDLAARDSATIGGMVATNAGGLHVVRYGPMRTQVEGVVAVLGDGRVVGRVPGLIKDNTGYSWPALLAGSEGTLGIVTEVHLRLVPHRAEHVTALVGLPDVAAAVALSGRLRRSLDSLLALELMLERGLALVAAHTGLGPPFPSGVPPVGLLVDCGGGPGSLERITAELGAALADEAEAAVATEPGPRARLWAYREHHTEAIATLGVPHKLDVTLPAAELAAFVARVPEVIAAAVPGAYPVLFGHVGDGNVHVNVLGVAPDDHAVDDAVVAAVVAHGGSISAEHGIGVAKAAYLPLVRRPDELAAFAGIRRALDPAGTLNPDVLRPPP